MQKPADTFGQPVFRNLMVPLLSCGEIAGTGRTPRERQRVEEAKCGTIQGITV